MDVQLSPDVEAEITRRATSAGKAPAEVIDKERAKLAEAEQAKAQLLEQRARIASL